MLTASQVGRARVVPANTMQDQLLLGRDSFMRNKTRQCVLPAPSLEQRPCFRRVRACTLRCSLSAEGAYVPNPKTKYENSHLRYAGNIGYSLSSGHETIEFNLVQVNGTLALVGQHPVEMVPDLAPVSELFVSHEIQVIPFSGAAEVEPGDLMGSASTPFVRVSIMTPHDRPN